MPVLHGLTVWQIVTSTSTIQVTFRLSPTTGIHDLGTRLVVVNKLPYTRVNKRNWLLDAYWLLSACFFPGFAPG